MLVTSDGTCASVAQCPGRKASGICLQAVAANLDKLGYTADMQFQF